MNQLYCCWCAHHNVQPQLQGNDQAVTTAHLFVELQRLFEHKARLGHGSLHTVHQQHHAIAHVEHTLHLTTKICVTRSVNHVDLDACITVGGGVG